MLALRWRDVELDLVHQLRISERVDAETASRQLGHSPSAITREFCIAKPAIAADVALVLEELGGGPGEYTGLDGS